VKHRNIPVDQIDPDPDQPRKDFDAAALQELADSIASKGQLQPTLVRPNGERFLIVAGERRWRAQKLLGAATMPCMVDNLSDLDTAYAAIIENAQRRDVNLIEEARAYQRLVDLGADRDEIAKNVGVARFRVDWRLSLLNLRADYQALAAREQLTPAQALEIAKLEPAGQDQLVQAIRRGEVPTVTTMRARAAQIALAANQTEAFPDDDAPTLADQRLSLGLEARVRKVLTVLNDPTIDREIVAARKVDPDRAQHLADLFREMGRDLARLETQLRDASAIPERATRFHA
jgi:ParB/RepB/Spo0J family partition protein